MKTMGTNLIDILVETEPNFSVICGRNGTFRIHKLRVWETTERTHVYLEGIGKRGVAIRGGICVTKECFTEVVRRFLAISPLLERRELATVLAALRLWQQTLNRHEELMWRIATDDGQVEALSDAEIEEFCEQLNTDIFDAALFTDDEGRSNGCQIDSEGFCATHGKVHQPPAMKKFKMVCAKCGSEEVLKDSYAIWSVEEQKWILHSVHDHTNCEKCGGECDVQEIVIKEESHG
jgi:hypothetical protein